MSGFTLTGQKRRRVKAPSPTRPRRSQIFKCRIVLGLLLMHWFTLQNLCSRESPRFAHVKRGEDWGGVLHRGR